MIAWKLFSRALARVGARPLSAPADMAQELSTRDALKFLFAAITLTVVEGAILVRWNRTEHYVSNFRSKIPPPSLVDQISNYMFTTGAERVFIFANFIVFMFLAY